jgi:SynChlorMet cassette radical SAM/SPASM protein ScmF
LELTQATPQLRTFYVYLTSGCNCACRHCYFVPADSRDSSVRTERLDPEILRRAIVHALPLGLQALKWTGGEPTFHPEFPTFLAMQKEFGLTASLETNGMLVDRHLADLLRDCGVRSVSVSLDGALAATHETIRGVMGGFERTCAGIRALVAAEYRPELIFTLQHANIAELDSFFDLAASLGAGKVKLNILQPMLRGAELTGEGEGLAVAELITLARRLEALKSSERLPVLLDIPIAFQPLGRLFDETACGFCSIRNILGILPRGAYALCGVGQHVSALAMGTVDTVSLDEVWRTHPVLVSIRSGLPRALQGVCGECLMKGVCLGHCLAVNYHHSDSLFAPFWFCQAAAEAGLFPVSRRKRIGKFTEE